MKSNKGHPITTVSAGKSQLRQIAELVILIAILLVLLGKLFFGKEDGFSALFIYGLMVTGIVWLTFIFAFLYYRDPYDLAVRSGVPGGKYMVSCMVAVKDEEGHIAQCVDSMLNQTYQKKEVIVVDDASIDGTLAILKDYEAKGLITLIALTDNVGKKRALSRAMEIAKGDIFAHTDSDSVWAPDAIEKIEKIFESDPDIGAVSGHGRALNADKNLLTKIQDSWMEGQFSMRKSFESVFNAVSCVSGPLAVFRREAIFNLIPAWESDRFLGQEFKFATDRTMTGFVLCNKSVGKKLKKKYHDSPFVQSVDYPEKDWKVVYSKAARSWTLVPDTFSRLIRQQVRWKKSFIRNVFFTGLFYWKKPVPVAFVYYAHLLFVVCGPFIVIRHLVYLPLQGDLLAAILYIAGICFIGYMFGLAYKLENPDSDKWVYRPLMSLMSTLVFSWLLYYSAVTIKRMTWHRG